MSEAGGSTFAVRSIKKTARVFSEKTGGSWVRVRVVGVNESNSGSRKGSPLTALVARAGCDSIRSDSSAGNVMDLSKTLASLPDNVSGRCIRDGQCHKVAVGFTLLREGLS